MLENENIPTTYKEAKLPQEPDKWQRAMEEEDNDTYELSPLPENRSVVGR